MKILYLLFTVVFLVLQGVSEFSQAERSTLACGELGGACFPLRCPSNSVHVRSCYPQGVCCR
ncbi:unnamed protein product, partial [Eretmochelys imbricata]